jgi:hypothetical protein
MSDIISTYSSSSTISTFQTRSSIITEKLLNCEYPYNFLSNIIEYKPLQKKHEPEELFSYIEDYLEIDLKNTFNIIKRNTSYQAEYKILLTVILSCVSSLLIKGIEDKTLIQSIVDELADSFESIVNIYCAFDANKKFFNKYLVFNNSKKDNEKNKNNINKEIINLEKSNVDGKNEIMEKYLEEHILEVPSTTINTNNDILHELVEEPKKENIVNNLEINSKDVFKNKKSWNQEKIININSYEKVPPINKKTNKYNLENSIKLFNETIKINNNLELNKEIDDDIDFKIIVEDKISNFSKLYEYIEDDNEFYINEINKIYNIDTKDKKKKLKRKINRCHQFIDLIENSFYDEIVKTNLTPTFIINLKTDDFNSFIKYIKEYKNNLNL